MSLSGRQPPRRKSSGGNLLDRFKSPPTSFQPPVAPSLSSTSPSSLYAPSNNFHSSGNSLHERESDGISLYSEGPSSLGMYEQSMASNGGGGGGASSINANPKEAQRSQETILLKRRREIDLLRKAHYGSHVWSAVIWMDQNAIMDGMDKTRMFQRAQSYSILGISISPLLEISDPQSFCAAMLRLLEEWEQYADADKPGGLKMNVFKASTRSGKRPSGSASDADTFRFLTLTNHPFQLDWFQSFITFCDILSVVYSKLEYLVYFTDDANERAIEPLKLPKTLAQSRRERADLSKLVEPDDLGRRRKDSSAWHPKWQPGLGEAVIKVDGKFKKILSRLVSEFEAMSRKSVKDELADLKAFALGVPPRPNFLERDPDMLAPDLWYMHLLRKADRENAGEEAYERAHEMSFM